MFLMQRDNLLLQVTLKGPSHVPQDARDRSEEGTRDVTDGREVASLQTDEHNQDGGRQRQQLPKLEGCQPDRERRVIPRTNRPAVKLGHDDERY